MFKRLEAVAVEEAEKYKVVQSDKYNHGVENKSVKGML